MLRNYLTIALRNLWKKGTHSVINILGLALGVASCLLVFIYVRNELTYDLFHENASNIYRVNSKYLNLDNTWEEYGITAPVMAPELARQIPELTKTMRLSRGGALTRHNDIVQFESFLYADPSMLEGFTFPLAVGELKSFTTDPNSMLITEETAKRLFGNGPAVGEKLEMEFKGQYETITVRGVLKDIPFNSSIQFKMVLPYSKYQQVANPHRFTEWLDQHIATFVLIDQPFDRAAVEKRITDIFRANIDAKERDKFFITLQPLEDIHLNTVISGGNGVQQPTSFSTSWLLIGIGVFLLVIASINFINISIAMALPRSKEIGLRKVAGARRRQIISQFLGESLLTCILALVIAAAMVDLFLPVFERLTNRSLTVWVDNSIGLAAILFSALVVTTLLAGTYPALVVSRFNPVKSLKGQLRVGGKNYLTRGLILVQFILGIMFLLGSLTIRQQLNYIEDFNLGFDDKGLIGIGGFRENGDALIAKFRNAVASSPLVKSVSGNSGDDSRTILNYEGKEYRVNHDRVDDNFFETYGVKLVAGRTFDPNRPADKQGAVIVNEAFVRTLNLKDPIGMSIPFTFMDSAQHPVIIGVMPDFHYASLKEKVDPLLLYTDPQIEISQMLVRVDPMQTAAAVEVLHDAWNKLVPGRPFEYIFAEEGIARYYAVEQKQKEIVSYASFFALFISCLGLFGLTNLTITQRTKEIGIRKILGATVRQITWLVSAEFLAIVLVANVVAWPVAFYFAQNWLSSFAYHIDLGWQTFVISTVAALLIAAITVSVQSVKSALANPAESLRSE